MLNPFDYYLRNGSVKRKTPDPEEAKSLLRKSINRLDYVNNQKINDKNANFIMEGAYETIREATQSLMSLEGFKPYSHEATISFLRKFYISYFSEDDIYKFDYFRKLRNDSVYRAVDIIEDDAKEIVMFAERFIQIIISLHKN